MRILHVKHRIITRLRDRQARDYRIVSIVLLTCAFVVLLIDIAVNFWRARALHRAAHDTNSQALAADALHFASDVFGSLAVLIGLGFSAFGFVWGDGAAAIGVAIMISVLGLRLGRSTVETLLDRAPEGVACLRACPLGVELV